MYYVYLLRSIKDPQETYVGYTTSLKARLQKHNEGGSVHAAKYRPWKLIMCLCFKDKRKALAF